MSADVAPAATLADLAAKANVEHRAFEAIQRVGLAHAIAAGKALKAAKDLVGHGGWLRWVEENCEFGEREAQNYMRIARNPQRVAHLSSIREALAELADPTPHPRPERTGTWTLAPSLEPAPPLGRGEPYPDFAECWIRVPWVTECPCCGTDLYAPRSAGADR
jgi:hypothetical protein